MDKIKFYLVREIQLFYLNKKLKYEIFQTLTKQII